MNHSHPAQVLVTLFDLARDGRHAHMGSVADRLGLSRAEVVAALVTLERRGLVDAARCRLSMSGLALASSLRAGRRSASRTAAPAAGSAAAPARSAANARVHVKTRAA